ncbi:predicted protein [Nematostella vectensis]|uniref:MAP3K12-binding inhibitory protein 1 n=1 Tax=Nematostella vectensis TaxID=45351 RepID=A7SAY1_NEMVE|nr:predicted protein [Nematostella vectensis]|eukprot:XP_001631190.1 predicted protein [Nematostella vectensis]
MNDSKENESHHVMAAIREALLAIQVFIRKLNFDHGIVQFTLDDTKMYNKVIEGDKATTLLEELTALLQGIKEKLHGKNTHQGNQNNESVTKKKRIERPNSRDEAEAVDWSLVQVTADNKEINRRITSFIERKRSEVDQLNRREFCNVVDEDSEVENSCARTEAVFIPRLGQRSHIKVTHINNTKTSDEAQALDHVTGLQGDPSEPKKTIQKPRPSPMTPALNERIRNMEYSLGVNPGRPVASDIYHKLQLLESRILYLEGLSPEYMSHLSTSSGSVVSSCDTSSFSQPFQTLSIDAIDERMKSLKQSLLRKHSS